MATYFFGKNVGSGIAPGAVTEQATTTGNDVEVVLNTTANVPNREALLLELQALYDYIAGKAAKNW
jgi:hypothetical protein